MKISKLIFYISAGFILGTFSLIAMQSVTSKNVKGLISGNENLLKEFNLNNELADLQEDILLYDNKLKNVVITGNSSNGEGLDKAITEIETDIVKLQKVKTDYATEKFIDDIDDLVHQKLAFNKKVLDSFNIAGKPAAVNLFATQKGNQLSEAISLLTEKNDKTRQGLLAEATKSVNKSGQLALLWGSLVIAVALVLFTFVFWFIVNRMKKQHDLINQLNAKEDKLKAALKIKENFLANMSHEIRTPLTAIMGYTSLLQRKSLDGESKLFVSTIEKSGENLLAIINDILDLSKIEAGMMRIEEAPFSIRELIHTVESMFRNKTKEKGLLLRIYVEPTIPDTLLGDATRLIQVLVNLMGNALKFTSTGEILLNVSTQKNDHEFTHLNFQIIDTGIGIENEKLEKIFERFSQAEDSTTRKYGGTGLGLSIVREIIYLQNGLVKVESEPGTGTSVSFTIPYKIATTQSIPLSYEEKNMPQHFSKNNKVLIVEDNKINQELLNFIFTQWNIGYTIASNGQEAIELLKKDHFDLVLMDIQMPEMDGYTATKEIRQALKLDIPIIAMTAHTMEGEREKCLSYGMNEHISKPIRENHLYRMITHFLNIYSDGNNMTEVLLHGKEYYNTINLNYLKEISNGDKSYEKTVTEQFIKLVPEEMLSMNDTIDAGNYLAVKKIAHNMKTSISVMGLNILLDQYLDAIENESLNEAELKTQAGIINVYLKNALVEADSFYKTL